MRMLRRISLVTIIAAGLMVSAPAHASDWELNKGDCEAVFNAYKNFAMPKLKQCTQVWMAYKDPATAEGKLKSDAIKAFQYLYTYGDEEGSYYASIALTNMGITPKATADAAPAKKGAAKAGDKSAKTAKKEAKPKKPARPKYNPPKASKSAQNKSKSYNKKGFKKYKKGDYEGALSYYEKAIDADGRNATALYNAACVHAIEGEAKEAVEYLWKLRDIGTKKAVQQVGKARNDEDFKSIHDDEGFKEVTGYAKIKICNGIKGEYSDAGDEAISNLKDRMEKLNFPVDTVTEDKHARKKPIVWYKPHSKISAYIISKIINHPKTKFQIIDWDSDFDIIISWGDKIKLDKYGDPVVKEYWPDDPDEANKKMDDMLFEQEKSMIEGKNYAHKVDKVVDTPQNTMNKVDSSKRKLESTINTFENTGNKVQGLFK